MNQSLRDYEDKLKWIVDNPNDTDADMAMIDAEILGESGHADVVRDVEKHQSEMMGVYPDGLVGDIAKHCMEISPVPNRPFALMAGLLTISLLSRNRYIGWHLLPVLMTVPLKVWRPGWHCNAHCLNHLIIRCSIGRMKCGKCCNLLMLSGVRSIKRI